MKRFKFKLKDNMELRIQLYPVLLFLGLIAMLLMSTFGGES